MKRTNMLGNPLFYKVGQMDAQSEDFSNPNNDGIFSGGGNAPTSNVLPPVTANPAYDVILIPSIVTHENEGNADASGQTTTNSDTDELNTNIPLTPDTSTPTTETTTTAKINKNWWWALAAGALAYKLSRH
jgi:hypothetical protein